MQYPVPVEEMLEGCKREFEPVSPKARELAAYLLEMANAAYKQGFQEGKAAAAKGDGK